MKLKFFNTAVGLISLICTALFMVSIPVEIVLDYSITNEFLMKYILDPGFKWITLVTHMFLHGSYEHLFFNLLIFWLVGTLLEKYIKNKWKFLLFFVLCGFGAAFLQQIQSIVVNDILDKHFNYGSLGASGSIFGVMCGILYVNRNEVLKHIGKFKVTALHLIIISLVFELLLNYTQQSNVAHYAHIGGGLTGFMLMAIKPIREFFFKK